jgi:S-adenosylmethionine synthetase
MPTTATPTPGWAARLATTNKIVIAGEGRASAPYMRKYGKHTIVNREALTEIAREVVRDIGYDQDGFSFHGADVEVLLHGQSPDIAMGVDAKKKGGNLGDQEGAGDQGLMFGFACRDSEEYEKGSFMPAPIYFSHRILEDLTRRAARARVARPAARRQEPGHRALRQRQGDRRHQGGGLHAAPRGDRQGQEIQPAWSRR